MALDSRGVQGLVADLVARLRALVQQQRTEQASAVLQRDIRDPQLLDVSDVEQLLGAVEEHSRVVSISLKGYILDEAAAATLAVFLQRYPPLRQLDLSFTRMGSQAAARVLPALSPKGGKGKSKVQSLDLSHCYVGLQTVAGIARSLESVSCHLRTLALRYNPVTAQGLGLILKWGIGITTIDCRYCGLLLDSGPGRQQGLEFLLEGLRENTACTALLLQGNGFTAADRERVLVEVASNKRSSLEINAVVFGESHWEVLQSFPSLRRFLEVENQRNVDAAIAGGLTSECNADRSFWVVSEAAQRHQDEAIVADMLQLELQDSRPPIPAPRVLQDRPASPSSPPPPPRSSASPSSPVRGASPGDTASQTVHPRVAATSAAWHEVMVAMTSGVADRASPSPVSTNTSSSPPPPPAPPPPPPHARPSKGAGTLSSGLSCELPAPREAPKLSDRASSPTEPLNYAGLPPRSVPTPHQKTQEVPSEDDLQGRGGEKELQAHQGRAARRRTNVKRAVSAPNGRLPSPLTRRPSDATCSPSEPSVRGRGAVGEGKWSSVCEGQTEAPRRDRVTPALLNACMAGDNVCRALIDEAFFSALPSEAGKRQNIPGKLVPCCGLPNVLNHLRLGSDERVTGIAKLLYVILIAPRKIAGDDDSIVRHVSRLVTQHKDPVYDALAIRPDFDSIRKDENRRARMLLRALKSSQGGKMYAATQKTPLPRARSMPQRVPSPGDDSLPMREGPQAAALHGRQWDYGSGGVSRKPWGGLEPAPVNVHEHVRSYYVKQSSAPPQHARPQSHYTRVSDVTGRVALHDHSSGAHRSVHTPPTYSSEFKRPMTTGHLRRQDSDCSFRSRSPSRAVQPLRRGMSLPGRAPQRRGSDHTQQPMVWCDEGVAGPSKPADKIFSPLPTKKAPRARSLPHG
eukprot:Sspe_Gene.31060::Locus_15335_Transcript_1_1_Confidence_1.000_Length_3013::g.31060::m.31060